MLYKWYQLYHCVRAHTNTNSYLWMSIITTFSAVWKCALQLLISTVVIKFKNKIKAKNKNRLHVWTTIDTMHISIEDGVKAWKKRSINTIHTRIFLRGVLQIHLLGQLGDCHPRKLGILSGISTLEQSASVQVWVHWHACLLNLVCPNSLL